MIKDIRYIIKRVIIGVLIVLALSFIRTCEVHALNQVQSVTLNYSGNNQQTSYDIFTSSNTLKNMGRGYLQFTYMIYDWKENATHYTASLREVRVESGNNIFTCSIGTISTSAENDDQYLVNVYSVLCPVVLGSSGLTKIHLETTNSGSGTTKSSQFMTFISDLDADNGAKLDVINSTIATYLQSVYNITSQVATNTTATNNYLSAIQTFLNTNLTQILQALTSSTSQIVQAQRDTTASIDANTQATQDQTNTIKDDNIDDSSSSINEMNSKVATNSVISDLLLLPITLFQNVLNSINGTCSPWNLGSLFGTNLVLPCINLSNLLGSALYGVIDVLLSGIFVLSIRKKFVDIFQNITSLKDGGNEIE